MSAMFTRENNSRVSLRNKVEQFSNHWFVYLCHFFFIEALTVTRPFFEEKNLEIIRRKGKKEGEGHVFKVG